MGDRMEIKNVTFIGLGVMGYNMAGHLKKNNYNTTVYNRTTAVAEKWVSEFKGEAKSTPGEAVSNADVVCICVGRDEDLISVMEGEQGIIQNIKEGTIVIDHTTASADIARKYYEQAKNHHFSFLDAPVSGGQAGAENGVLSVMVGGDQDQFDKAKPIMGSYGKSIELIGNAGSGQLAKMINQICIAGLVQGLSEAMAFGKKANLDMEKVLQVISKGAAQSWQMENRYRTMTDDKFDYGFAIDWMRKDLAIVIEEAKRNGSPVPITEIIDGYYAEVQKMGGNRWDSSGLIARLKKKK